MENYEYVVEKIKSLPVKFNIKGKAKFSQNGIDTETIVLEYEGSEFVYVEGKKDVELGWDSSKCSIGKSVVEVLKGYYEEGKQYYDDERQEMIESYNQDIENAKKEGDIDKAKSLEEDLKYDLEMLSNECFSTFHKFMENFESNLDICTSELRNADICPMIVEVDSRYIENDTTIESFMNDIKDSPFSILTEDEWEYICNGGKRTLFRWGDSLKYELDEMFGIGRVGEEVPKILTSPNMFGLKICYDSYKLELIDSTNIAKGGDGGCSLCGGEGAAYVIPAFTAFYRYYINKSNISRSFYSYRRIIRL